MLLAAAIWWSCNLFVLQPMAFRPKTNSVYHLLVYSTHITGSHVNLNTFASCIFQLVCGANKVGCCVANVVYMLERERALWNNIESIQLYVLIWKRTQFADNYVHNCRNKYSEYIRKMFQFPERCVKRLPFCGFVCYKLYWHGWKICASYKWN